MSREEDQLREDALGRRLNAALSRERAPEAWSRAALAAPRRPAAVPVTAPEREEPWILSILPHLCGLALLVGLGISLWMRPEIIQGLLNSVAAEAARPETGQPLPAPLFMAAALLTPAAILLMVEASRGFPLVRRWIASVS